MYKFGMYSEAFKMFILIRNVVMFTQKCTRKIYQAEVNTSKVYIV